MIVHDGLPIGALKAQIRRQILELETFLIQLIAITTSSTKNAKNANHVTRRKGAKRNHGIGRAAVTILREAGRPLHALTELLPRLEERGFRVASRSGLATVLMRTGDVVRVAPGTFAVRTTTT